MKLVSTLSYLHIHSRAGNSTKLDFVWRKVRGEVKLAGQLRKYVSCVCYLIPDIAVLYREHVSVAQTDRAEQEKDKVRV